MKHLLDLADRAEANAIRLVKNGIPSDFAINAADVRAAAHCFAIARELRAIVHSNGSNG